MPIIRRPRAGCDALEVHALDAAATHALDDDAGTPIVRRLAGARHAAEQPRTRDRRPSSRRRCRSRGRAARRARRSSARPETQKRRPSSCSISGSSSSYSSRISPTISSRMSSIVTSPAVPPYSSMTIAMCVRLALKSRSCWSMRLRVGMNSAGRTSVGQPARLFVGDDDGQQILRVENADDVVERVVEHRKARVLGAADAVEDLGPRRRRARCRRCRRAAP